MKFKKCTKNIYFTQHLDKAIKEIKKENGGRFYHRIVNVNDDMNLSDLDIKECINVIAIDNFYHIDYPYLTEKKIILNIYKRVS